MGGFLTFIILYIPIIIIATIIVKNKNNKQNNNQQQYYQQPQQPSVDQEQDQEQDWTKTYQKTHLLTKNEYYEYKKLKQYADKNNLIICPKVRLLDIIVPRENTNRAALGKISSKHADFVICDDKLYVKGIIEIDDNSHKQQDRKERDQFVDSVLTSVGYKVVHTYSVTEETLNCFIEKKEIEQ